MNESVLIREARQTDMEAVHGLIMELAIYEKEPEAVTITTENLIQDGFGDHPCFDCFVATKEGKVIGFALFYMKYSTWKGPCLYLEDFLVTQSERGKGIGKQLFDRVLDTAKARKVKRFEWQVLDWNEPAIHFYKKYETVFEEDWINARILF